MGMMELIGAGGGGAGGGGGEERDVSFKSVNSQT